GLSDRSPISFPGFAEEMVNWAPVVGFSPEEIEQIKKSLKERGLYQAPQVSPGWAAVGPGISFTPGIRVLDHPFRLQSWLYSSGRDGSVITQGVDTGLNSKADSGEVIALGFDLQNQDDISVARPHLLIVSKNPHVY